MNFEDALNAFKELLAIQPDSILYNLYISRIEHFMNNPSNLQDWDGCFTFLDK